MAPKSKAGTRKTSVYKRAGLAFKMNGLRRMFPNLSMRACFMTGAAVQYALEGLLLKAVDLLAESNSKTGKGAKVVKTEHISRARDLIPEGNVCFPGFIPFTSAKRTFRDRKFSKARASKKNKKESAESAEA